MKGLIATFLAICMMLCASQNSLARPVSYPGSITLMQMNNASSNSLHIHYSPTAKYSIGYLGERHRNNADWQFHGVQFNYLVKRWNQPSSQANVYSKSGVGGAFDGNSGLAAFTGIALDWEDRRYFTAYENRFYHTKDLGRFLKQEARIGIAPYIGGYGDLHTWLMLQVNRNPTQDIPNTATALVRLFKSEYLAEFGVSNQRTLLANLIVRF